MCCDVLNGTVTLISGNHESDPILDQQDLHLLVFKNIANITKLQQHHLLDLVQLLCDSKITGFQSNMCAVILLSY